ncbi:MAG: hypothetical protein M0P76_00100 [Candidatus Pacebacteria bacterium]|jgi:parallel beta-helix repeat protein|nr:hypothetical protein [Candidatus Paceibacterota bacterium]
MKKIIFLATVLFFAPSFVFAGTPVWGTLNSDTVWTAESGPYLVDFAIVPEGVTLTVEEGTVVKFTGQRSMLEVSGNLVVSGTELSPVVFTSINDDSVGGDTGTGANEWGNILIKNGGVAEIDHTIVRYGGWTGWLSSAAPSNIWNDGGNLTLTNSKISNAWTGITHSAGNTALTENIFTENHMGISAGGTGNVRFDHNNFFNNTGNVAWFDLTNGVSLAHSDNTAWGGTPGLVLAGEAGADYVFEKDGAPYVIDHFTVPAGKTVTSRQGTAFKILNPVSEINISGTWNAEGTSDEPVYFTSIKDDTVLGDTNGDADATSPAKKDWEGIIILQDGKANFDHSVFRYGGYNGWLQSTYSSNISNNGGVLIISNSEISHAPIGVNHVLGNTSIYDSNLSENIQGINAMGKGVIEIKRNIFANTSYACSLKLSELLLTNAGNKVLGNGFRGFNIEGTLSTNQTLAKDVPYIVSTITIPAGKMLTVLPGAVIKMKTAYGRITVDGEIQVLGTKDDPIYFTSIKDDEVYGDTNGDGNVSFPQPGNWSAVVVHPGGAANFDHAIIKYGGYYYYGDSILYNDGGTLSVKNSQISFSPSYGIYHRSGSTTVNYSTIRNNGFGVFNAGSESIDATNNFWGTAAGPNHNGLPIEAILNDKVSDQVNYAPWLDYDPMVTLPTSITLTNGGETENDDLQDGKGVADKTQFTFSVVASENLVDIKLVTDSSDVGINPGQFFLYASGTEGVYSRALTFPKGHYRYHFEAGDGNGGVYRYPEATELEFTTGYSNVAFLPGIEASRLYINGYKQWEPLGDNDAEDLLMNSNGKSVKDNIYTKDVINNAYLPIKGNVYQSFIESMNELKSSHIITDWKPLAYDWRLSFGDVLNNGQIMNDGINYTREISPLDTPNIIGEIHRLAESSDTGKVTIVTHSMGGLLAKKLAIKLGADAPKLLDQMIFVASPQAGTPQAIGALLHGADVALPLTSLDYGISPKEGRKLSQNMPSAYSLLPSAKYFRYVDNSVITFDDSDFLEPWRTKYGQKIHSQELLRNFLIDQARPPLTVFYPLNFPASTNPTLLANAETLHDTEIDNWEPPTGVQLTEIAGWGVETLATIEYKKGIYAPCIEWKEATCVKKDEIPVLEPHLKTVVDGDGTVVVPSALWTATSTGVRKYWVDLATYNSWKNLFQTGTLIARKHADIFEVPEIRDFTKNLILRNGIIPEKYIFTSTPPNTFDSDMRLHFTLHSPLALNLYDDQGNHTGYSTTTRELEENIPGSQYIAFGELKYISVPASSNLHLAMNGYASGSFTLDVEEWQGDAIMASTTFAAIPSATSTVATMSVLANEGVAGVSPLYVDENGDGTIDMTLAPKIDGTVFPDFTPPEAKISVDPATKDLLIEGVDENPTTISENGNTYTITDSSGNTTTLFFQKTFTAKRLTFAKLTGVQYGTDPKISLPSSSFLYLWNPALDSQTVAVKKDFIIEAVYNKQKNQTTVFLKKKGEKTQKQTFVGLKVVKLTVDKGMVGYEI